MKRFLWIVVIVLLSENLYSFNPEDFDLNRPITQNLKVNILKMENFDYVAGIIKNINKAIRKDRKNLKLYALRNMYLYILWDIAPLQRKKEIALVGMKAADETIRFFPTSADGWMWKGIFMGIYGLARGVLNALNIAGDVRTLLMRAYSIDPKYFYAMAPQVLGRMYFKLPGLPLSFGNIKKARKYLYEAYRYYPEFAHIYMFLAELEASEGHLRKAERFLNEIPNLKPRTWYELLIKRWTMREVDKAKTMLQSKHDKYTYDFLLDPVRHLR